MSAFSDFGVPGLILCRPIDAYSLSIDIIRHSKKGQPSNWLTIPVTNLLLI